MLPGIERRDDLEVKFKGYLDQVCQYHDVEKQELARALLPMDELQEKAAIALAKEGKFDPSSDELNHYVLLQLLFWFKATFRWVNSPPCDFCGSETAFSHMDQPSFEDLQFGAQRVEAHRCRSCGLTTRFPRYNDPLKLMETQRGRCGEYANCFTFLCIALGYNARFVIDFGDHVWTECNTPYLKRWMHLDPCEGIYDKPLLYEKGWGKKLSYVIAFAKDGVHDVTKRYTRKWQELLPRRINEDAVEEIVAMLCLVQRSVLTPEEFDLLEQQDAAELQEILEAQSDAAPAPNDESLPGRLSGSEEWRASRGELGSKPGWPERKCKDEHVGDIFGAIGLLSKGNKVPESKLKLIYNILERLKNLPFKERTLKLGTKDEAGSFFGDQGAEALFDAIGMQTVVANDGMVSLCMKESPGKVALALAVATETLQAVVTANCNPEAGLRLMTCNKRVCGGIVCSSGEEPPSGLATSAFDGLVSTKWEEPDGAKGAWLVYHLAEGVSQRIFGYDLTSANDFPERDPMNWILEGSNDHGNTWTVLDSRSGLTFDARFERKSFEVSTKLLCSILRFRFCATRDCKNNSRMQLACIDFYQS